MRMITCKNITKAFPSSPRGHTVLRRLRSFKEQNESEPSVPVLRDVSLNIERGQRVALIGENGCGKTTLCRILCGIYQANHGTITVEGRLRALFEYRVGCYVYLPVIDNIYVIGAIHGIERAVLDTLIDEILETCGIGHLRWAEMRELSIGQQQRLTLSVFMHAQGDIYVFDESLAHIDRSFSSAIERFMGRLVAEKKTIIITSHSSSILRRYCTEAMWLDNGRIREFGNVDTVINGYETYLQSRQWQALG